MQAAATAGTRIQKAIDWAVFGIGALALSTAILATAFGGADSRLADNSADAATISTAATL